MVLSIQFGFGSLGSMKKPILSYQRQRFPTAISSNLAWLYYRFCLSFSEFEEILAEREVTVTYETVR